jgi:hypothetical protein
MNTNGAIFTNTIIRLTAIFIQNNASTVEDVTMERTEVENISLFIKTSQ